MVFSHVSYIHYILLQLGPVVQVQIFDKKRIHSDSSLKNLGFSAFSVISANIPHWQTTKPILAVHLFILYEFHCFLKEPLAKKTNTGLPAVPIYKCLLLRYVSKQHSGMSLGRVGERYRVNVKTFQSFVGSHVED